MIAEISLVPIGSGEKLSEAVAEVLDIIDHSGIDYILTPMGTILEGEWDEVMDLVKECHNKLKKKHPRVLTSIKIDDREGAQQMLKSKVDQVENKLGRKLSRTNVE